jgi:hypothetical protein
MISLLEAAQWLWRCDLLTVTIVNGLVFRSCVVASTWWPTVRRGALISLAILPFVWALLYISFKFYNNTL